MKVPKDLLYTEEHEWVSLQVDVATVGITDYAQGELGDVVFVELPEVNTEVRQMEPFGTIEAVKAVTDLFAPLSGKVIETNVLLQDNPELVNKDPYGDGWMLKIQINDQSECEVLLNADLYQQKVS